jgi:predicted ATP-grasp superfamily ATP-dependent carboligase
MHNKSRLKIWVCEYVSAGGLACEPLPAGLLQEGLLMRDALLADLSALGVDCITSHDSRVAMPRHADSQAVYPDDDPYTLWRQQLTAHDIDACWVIAPETDGILYGMHALVQAANKPWIGCTAEGIRQASAKSLMTEICQQAGVPVLPYVFLERAEPLENLPWYGDAMLNGWVIKPDDGAGCELTYYFNNDLKVIEYNNKFNCERSSRLILQPYLPGRSLSMSVLSTRDQVKVIAGHEQLITVQEDMFRFQGAGVNQAAEYLPVMQDLAEKIHRAIPGLLGYWGADMILTPDNQLTLVEVNPRLTTPYIAMSQLLSANPAGMILDAMLKQSLKPSIAQSSITLTLASAATSQVGSLSV